MYIKIKTITLLLFLVFTLSACVSHYRYESAGEVTNSANQKVKALLYWYGDDGRLWYGRSYYQADTNIEMNICKATSKVFSPINNNTGNLMLTSRNGDLQVGKIASNGEVITLSDPVRLTPNSNCGQISVNGKISTTQELNKGISPDVYILCKHPFKTNRYPMIGRYNFNSITKTKMKENIPPIDVCQ